MPITRSSKKLKSEIRNLRVKDLKKLAKTYNKKKYIKLSQTKVKLYRNLKSKNVIK